MTINKWTVVPYLAAIALLVATFVRVAKNASWFDHFIYLGLAMFGTVTFLFTDAVVELIEDDKPHQEWFQRPNYYAKAGGAIGLLYGAGKVFGVI